MMKSGQSQMPPTVSDQIRLWEQERDKFIFTEGVLYNQFLSQADYEMVRSYAEQSGMEKNIGWELNTCLELEFSNLYPLSLLLKL